MATIASRGRAPAATPRSSTPSTCTATTSGQGWLDVLLVRFAFASRCRPPLLHTALLHPPSRRRLLLVCNACLTLPHPATAHASCSTAGAGVGCWRVQPGNQRLVAQHREPSLPRHGHPAPERLGGAALRGWQPRGEGGEGGEQAVAGTCAARPRHACCAAGRCCAACACHASGASCDALSCLPSPLQLWIFHCHLLWHEYMGQVSRPACACRPQATCVLARAFDHLPLPAHAAAGPGGGP